jgi:oxygen-dependent protoporphyrinogen oxidase
LPAADIQVLEAGNRPGGTIWTERRDGFQVEVGANGFLDNNPSTIQLCKKLGLADRLLPAGDTAKHRFLFWNERLQQLPECLWQFIRSPLLSWRGKLAVLTERFQPPRADNADESVHDFAARRTNREVAEIFADALVTGIHAGDPHLLSMKAAFPRFAAMEREHGSLRSAMRHMAAVRRSEALAKGEMPRQGSRLLSFREGLRLLVEMLRDDLRQPPTFGVHVRRIESLGNGQWQVNGDGHDRWPADAVVLACPAHQQAALMADVDAQLAEAIGAIPYAAAMVVALGYRREDVPGSVDGFGFIAPQRTKRDILGVQWCSSIYPDRAPPGMVLLRAICGGWHRGEIASWDEERVRQAVRKELQNAMGITAAPIFEHIQRWEKAIPQYHLGHLERVAKIESLAATHPGLLLTGNAYHGVAMNDCTEQAEKVAARVAAYLSENRATIE